MKRIPTEMSRADFEEAVSDALDTLPTDITERLDNVVILVEEEHPTEDILGLYEGVALTDRYEYSGHLPDVITIYRRPILQMVDDAATAKREIAITVAHEVGHHFGIDDERLHELGFG